MKAEGRRSLVVVGVILLALASASAADVIWTGSSAGRGLRQEVDILGVENGELVYLINGNRATSPLGRVLQIELEGDADFNAAEQAFSAGDWTRAAQGYGAAVRGHAKEWARRRAAERLVASAGNAGLFAEAVNGYVQLTLLDPRAAIGLEPQMGENVQPAALELAANQVQQALERGGLTRAQERTLLTFLMSLHNRRGDEAAAGAIVERLGAVLGDNPDEDPKLFAQVLLGRANLALTRNQPEEAAKLINDNRRLFTDPQQQSAALMTLARVAERQAGEDRAGLLDAALAYMKVVTFFKRADGAPNVAEALLRAALIHEKLGLPGEAARLYREIVSTYAASPFAAEAQRRLDSMGG